MNRTLDELASRDGLTRLQNRRSLTKSVADDHGRLRGDCWLGFIDLDRFKDINDTLGHAIGDLVLITVAERWSRLLPQSAMLARTGGDEFALFIPDATAEDALELSPATHRRVDRTGICRGMAGEPFASAMSRADSALYEMKSSGRNGVVALSATSD
jgi:diguanylate cyclase (GGDEF)-like protein